MGTVGAQRKSISPTEGEGVVGDRSGSTGVR